MSALEEARERAEWISRLGSKVSRLAGADPGSDVGHELATATTRLQAVTEQTTALALLAVAEELRTANLIAAQGLFGSFDTERSQSRIERILAALDSKPVHSPPF